MDPVTISILVGLQVILEWISRERGVVGRTKEWTPEERTAFDTRLAEAKALLRSHLSTPPTGTATIKPATNPPAIEPS